jgi:hypothetical protein
MLPWGHAANGYTRFFLGEFVAARTRYEKSRELSDLVPAAAYAAGKIDDPRTTNCAWLSVCLVYLGHIDQGRSLMSNTLAPVRQAHKIHGLLSTLAHACWIGYLVGSAQGDVQRHAEDLLALSREHGSSHWLGWGMLYHGRLLTAVGQTAEGLTLLTKGLSEVRETGGVASTPFAWMMLAEAYTMLGKLVQR